MLRTILLIAALTGCSGFLHPAKTSPTACAPTKHWIADVAIGAALMGATAYGISRGNTDMPGVPVQGYVVAGVGGTAGFAFVASGVEGIRMNSRCRAGGESAVLARR